MAKVKLIYDPEWGWRSQEWLDKNKGKGKPTYRSHDVARKEVLDAGDEIVHTDDRGLSYHYDTGPKRHYNPYYDEGIYDEADFAGEGSYDYGFDVPVYYAGGKRKDEEESKYWKKQWGEYEKSGEWKGYSYYRKSTIDYKYIDQMANIFSAKHNIEVRIGSDWSVDLKKKILTYNPVSLMYGTKGDVIATLLHEVGTVSYVTPWDELKSPFIAKYWRPAVEVLDAFEDYRTDELMADSYPSARELMEANKKMYGEKVDKMLQVGEYLREYLLRETKNSIDRAASLASSTLQPGKTYYGMEADKIQVWVDKDDRELMQSVLNLRNKIKNTDNIFDYLAHFLDVSRGLGKKTNEMVSPKVQKMVQDTLPALKNVTDCKDSQACVEVMDKEIYPVIEELLKNWLSPEAGKDLAEMFGAAYARQMIASVLEQVLDDANMELTGNNNKNPASRQSSVQSAAGRGDDLPKDWADGDYQSLKDSVGSPIRELTRKLRNLRAVEQTPKWMGGHRRGRLNPKDLYKHASGNQRLFKKQQEIKDTIKSFAFSFMFDRSGSMQGEKVIHSMRGLIILMETFESLDIPFEVIAFGDGPSILKKFGDALDKDKKKRIAGMITACNTGTTLNTSLKKLEIGSRPEKNKTLIVLSDGDLSDVDESKTVLAGLSKKGVKTLAYALRCRVESVARVFGSEHSEAVADPNQLPDIFDNMFRKLLKEKGGISI